MWSQKRDRVPFVSLLWLVLAIKGDGAKSLCGSGAVPRWIMLCNTGVATSDGVGTMLISNSCNQAPSMTRSHFYVKHMPSNVTLLQNHRIREAFMLEKTYTIIQSNYKPNTTKFH